MLFRSEDKASERDSGEMTEREEERMAIKIDCGYVYKIYGENIHWCDEPIYHDKAKAKRYMKRLEEMCVKYETL